MSHITFNMRAHGSSRIGMQISFCTHIGTHVAHTTTSDTCLHTYLTTSHGRSDNGVVDNVIIIIIIIINS